MLQELRAGHPIKRDGFKQVNLKNTRKAIKMPLYIIWPLAWSIWGYQALRYLVTEACENKLPLKNYSCPQRLESVNCNMCLLGELSPLTLKDVKGQYLEVGHYGRGYVYAGISQYRATLAISGKGERQKQKTKKKVKVEAHKQAM